MFVHSLNTVMEYPVFIPRKVTVICGHSTTASTPDGTALHKPDKKLTLQSRLKKLLRPVSTLLLKVVVPMLAGPMGGRLAAWSAGQRVAKQLTNTVPEPKLTQLSYFFGVATSAPQPQGTVVRSPAPKSQMFTAAPREKVVLPELQEPAPVHHEPVPLEAPQAHAAAPADDAWNQDYLDLLNEMNPPTPAAAPVHSAPVPSAAAPSQPDTGMDPYEAYYSNPPTGN